MRAFLGRTAFYWLPFLITVSGFSLPARWWASFPPPGRDNLFGPPGSGPWYLFTFLIGLPGMGTLCAIIGARAQQRGTACVAGLAGLVASSSIAMLLGGIQLVGVAVLDLVVIVPFLVGFGVAALLLRGR